MPPIEIKELTIKFTLTEKPTTPKPQTQMSEAEKKALVQECVRKVLEVLAEQEER